MTTPQLGYTDHFSGVARGYATFRPHYPASLFSALARVAPNTLRVWDCACGTGQASVALAAHFAEVIATDLSAAQVAQGEPHAGVEYRVATAEASGLENASVSAVTVAQALHWFDVDAFHVEARRVLMPGGIVAEWSYALLDVPTSPALTQLVHGLDARMKTWWPPQRAHVDARYETLPFPFERIAMDDFAMQAEWTLPQLRGYVETWSAITRYRAAHGDDSANDPAREFAIAAQAAWGDAPTHTISWPLVLRVGRVTNDGAINPVYG